MCRVLSSDLALRRRVTASPRCALGWGVGGRWWLVLVASVHGGPRSPPPEVAGWRGAGGYFYYGFSQAF